MDKVVGINPVSELLKSGRKVKKIEVAEGNKNTRVKEILEMAKKNNIEVEIVKEKTDNNQGITAWTEDDFKTVEIGELLEKLASKPKSVIVILDELNDPRNFGAIIRSAEGFGADAIIIPEHKSVKMSDVVIKASTGAYEYIDISIAGNISNLIRELKKIDYWIYGAEADGTKEYYAEKYPDKVCLVIGSEGKGIRQKVKENCDIIVSIPMYGKVNSLNASVAAGILLAEISKNRRS